MSTVISIANQKGGVGKTTTTIEIANNMAVYEKRVLVIDLDSQTNLSQYVNADQKKPTIYQVLHGQVTVKDAIQTVGRFDLISGSEGLSKADREFIGVDDVYIVADLVELVQEDYDYILVDTGPARNILINMAYVASDYIIIPIIPDDGALLGVGKVYNDILQLRTGKRQMSHARILSMILNDYHSGWNNDKQKLDNINYFGEQMDEDPDIFTVRTYTGTKECKTMKMAIMDYDKNSNAAIDFKNLTYDLIEKMEEKA